MLVSTTIKSCTMPSVCQLFTRERFWHQVCGRSTLVRPLLFLCNIKASSSNVVNVDSFRSCYWTFCFELMISEQFQFGVSGNSLVQIRIFAFSVLMIGTRTVLVAIPVHAAGARASHLPLYQAPNILGFNGQDQFHFAQFCLA